MRLRTNCERKAAKLPSLRTKGIILRAIKVGEADKILTIFSREHGKLSAIAKGARKPTSKFGGRLEVFGYNDYLLGSGQSLYVVSQVETVESFYSLREEPETLKAASFIVKLVNSAVDEGHKNQPLFDLLLSSLQALNAKGNPSSVQIAFEFKFMDVEGFFPFGESVPERVVKQMLYLKKKTLTEIGLINIKGEDIERLKKISRLYISEHIGKDIRTW